MHRTKREVKHMTNYSQGQLTDFQKSFLTKINSETEIAISYEDDFVGWIWTHRCIESEDSFSAPELALINAIQSLCKALDENITSNEDEDEDENEPDTQEEYNKDMQSNEF